MSSWGTAETVISVKRQCCALLRTVLLEAGCLSTAVPQSATCDNQLSDRLRGSASKETSQLCASSEQAGVFMSHSTIFHGQLLSSQLWTYILVFLCIARVN